MRLRLGDDGEADRARDARRLRPDRDRRRGGARPRERARRGPIDALGADFVPLYRTRLLAPDPPQGDVVVLASGSAARAYAAVGGTAPAVSIGPETSRVAASVGLTVRAEAATHDLDGLVAAVRDLMKS